MTLSNYSPIIDLFLPDVTKTKAVYLGIKTSFPAASAILKLKTVQDFFAKVGYTEWSSPSAITIFPISELSYFIIRFLNYLFFVINFSYFVILL